MKYVLALDQGTTSSRAIVFAEDGSLRAQAQQEFRQIFPQPGWVEHDPEEIWASQLSVARRALAQARLKAADIAAIGIANQRETTIVWERKSGQPVHNAIVWQDRRTADACAGLKRRGKTQLVQSTTGLVLDPYFSATKLAWLLDSVPGLRLHAERGELAFGTVDSWLAWKLSGGGLHVTDVSNASRTMLYDIHVGDWDEALLSLFRIPRSMLPRVLPSSRVYGESTKRIFGAPIPIAGIAGDQQAALFGQACHAPGMAKNTYGTGCFMLLNTGPKAVPSKHGLLTTRCAQRGPKPQYALEGSVFIARRGGAVAARRPGLHPLIGRNRSARRERGGHGRRLPGAGLRRAGRAALGRLRARHHARPHARHHARAHRARCARGHRLPVGRSAAGDAKGRRHPAEGTARGRRRRAPTTC